jgi:glutaconate CoA-transferase, subunit B
MMTVAAARALATMTCFVGIGLRQSGACNLARLTHARDMVLIYESGTIADQARTCCRSPSATASCARRR